MTYVVKRQLDDGRALFIYRMMFGYRLCIGPDDSPVYDDFYCYPREPFEALGWDGQGDPPGPWIKHGGTGRTREYGPDGQMIRESHDWAI